MKPPEKKFYSCVDAASIKEVPQPIQHLAIGKMAEQTGGQVVFFVAEEPYTHATHEVILGRLKTSPDVDGVVFYRLAQFARGGRIQIGIMRGLIERGYELHFARERVSVQSLSQASDAFRKLYVYDWTERMGRRRLDLRSA